MRRPPVAASIRALTLLQSAISHVFRVRRGKGRRRADGPALHLGRLLSKAAPCINLRVPRGGEGPADAPVDPSGVDRLRPEGAYQPGMRLASAGQPPISGGKVGQDRPLPPGRPQNLRAWSIDAETRPAGHLFRMTIPVPPEEKAERLNRLLTVCLLRIAGIGLFGLGIDTWISLVGIHDGPLFRFDLMPVWWKMA